MGCEYHFDMEQKVLFLRRYGRVDGPELHATLKEITALRPFAEMDKFLIDLEDADLSCLDTRDLEKHAAYVGQLFAGRRVKAAIIAPSDLAFGLSRMYEFLSAVRTIMVFRSREEGIKWLEIEDIQGAGG